MFRETGRKLALGENERGNEGKVRGESAKRRLFGLGVSIRWPVARMPRTCCSGGRRTNAAKSNGNRRRKLRGIRPWMRCCWPSSENLTPDRFVTCEGRTWFVCFCVCVCFLESSMVVEDCRPVSAKPRNTQYPKCHTDQRKRPTGTKSLRGRPLIRTASKVNISSVELRFLLQQANLYFENFVVSAIPTENQHGPSPCGQSFHPTPPPPPDVFQGLGGAFSSQTRQFPQPCLRKTVFGCRTLWPLLHPPKGGGMVGSWGSLVRLAEEAPRDEAKALLSLSRASYKSFPSKKSRFQPNHKTRNMFSNFRSSVPAWELLILALPSA